MCFGSRKGDDMGAARSRELDKIIRADEKRMSKEVKLLLLGSSILLVCVHIVPYRYLDDLQRVAGCDGRLLCLF